MNSFARALIAMICIALPAAAPADTGEGVNRIRQRGCAGKSGLNAPLRRSEELDEVARQWSRGGRLHDAIARTGYRVVSSSSMRVEGANDEASLLRLLAENYCEVILEPSFTEIGVLERKRDVWIVVAKPFSAPAAQEVDEVGRRVLQLINVARSKPRKCGRASFAAAAPLELSAQLTRAALVHAKDMAANEFFEHEGSDGSQPANRVSRTGYRWRVVGENIASGAADAETVVSGWLQSPGHCVNVMGAQYSEMGVAYFVDRKSKAGIYWSQVFARPRGR